MQEQSVANPRRTRLGHLRPGETPGTIEQNGSTAGEGSVDRTEGTDTVQP
ncbi:hypothetical protein [Actinokineospora enzanensis]|nr:hypothetical protein [Actinokineospora enzanensis]